MLISPNFTTRVSGNGITRITLWGSPHGKVSVLWNTGPTPATYDYWAAMPTATRIDRSEDQGGAVEARESPGLRLGRGYPSGAEGVVVLRLRCRASSVGYAAHGRRGHLAARPPERAMGTPDRGQTARRAMGAPFEPRSRRAR